MKPKISKPIYYTDGTAFYRKYRGVRALRNPEGKWVELPCYEKPVMWEIPSSDVDDPEYPSEED